MRNTGIPTAVIRDLQETLILCPVQLGYQEPYMCWLKTVDPWYMRFRQGFDFPEALVRGLQSLSNLILPDTTKRKNDEDDDRREEGKQQDFG
jgi:hypothetical protein